MTYTHAPIVPANERERVVAEAIDPFPFERKRRGREYLDDRSRRRQAVIKARRVLAALERVQ